MVHSTVALFISIAADASTTPAAAVMNDHANSGVDTSGRSKPRITVNDRNALAKVKVNTIAMATPCRVRPW